MNLDITPGELQVKLNALIQDFYHNVNAYACIDKITINYLEHDPTDPYVTYTIVYGIAENDYTTKFQTTLDVSPFDLKNEDMLLGQFIQLVIEQDTCVSAQ